MTVLVFDEFNGANGTDIADHSPDIDVVGGGWQQSELNLVELDGSGAAKFATAGDSAWIDTGNADQIVRANINAGGADNRFQLVARSDNKAGTLGTNYSLNMRQGVSGSDNLFLFKRVNGSSTLITSTQLAFDSSQTNEFELSAIGNNIIAKVDGVEIFNLIDSSITSGTYAGFYHALYTDGNLRVYDFEVDDGGAVEPPVVSVTDFSLSLRQPVLSNTTISAALRAYKENVASLSVALRQSAANTTQLNTSLRKQVANTTAITTSLLVTVLNGVAGVTSFNFALRSQTQNTITIETSLRELVSSNTELSSALRAGVISTHEINAALRQGVQSVTPFAFNLIGGVVGVTSLATQLRESAESTTNFTFQLFGEIDWTAPGKQALFTIQVTPANFTISTQKPEL